MKGSDDVTTIDVTRNGGEVTIRPSGELDAESVRPLRKALADIGESRDCTRLVIDLRGVAFMDSTGIHLLLTALDQSRREGFDLVLMKAPASVHRVLVLTRLDERFVIVDGPAQAG